MKKILLSLLLTFAVTSTSIAQNVSITDYKVPVSQAKSLLLNLDYNYAGVGDSTIANNGNLRSIYRQFYSSLPFSWTINVDGAGSKLRDDTQHNLSFSTTFNRYFSNEGNFFGFGGLQALHTTRFKRAETRVSAGVGYGRFISATAFAKAIRIDNFLLDEGVITDHLEKDQLIEIGNIIEREQEYRDRYGATYEPQWYEDMEAVIKNSGKLKGETVGAIGILRMKEVLFFETIHDRFYGWSIRGGVAYDLTKADKSSGDPSAEIALSFSYPMSLSTQINHQTQYNSEFNNFGEAYSIASSTDYIYELSNRIDFVGAYQFQSAKPGTGVDAINSHALRASFIFYIENQINLVLNGQMDKTSDFDWNRSFVVTLGYRIF